MAHIERYEFLCSFVTTHAWVTLQGDGGLVGAGCTHVDPDDVNFSRILRDLKLRTEGERARNGGVLRVECAPDSSHPMDIRETRCNEVKGARARLSDGTYRTVGE
jgi:hypothetical protein